jgi:lipopolysaccharide transport system permease protein
MKPAVSETCQVEADSNAATQPLDWDVQVSAEVALERAIGSSSSSFKAELHRRQDINFGAPRALSLRRATYLVDLLIVLVGRETRLIYKRSALGLAWSLLNPLLQQLVLFVVFHSILAIRVDHYASFLCSGLLVWNWFQTSLSHATGTVVNNQQLLKQPAFSPSVLPIAAVTTWFLHFLVATPIIFIFMLIDGIHITQAALFLPVIWVFQFLFTLLLSYPLAALYVTFRDVQHILGVLLNLTFYFTPIIYTLSSVPPGYRWLYDINPMSTFVDSYRSVLITGTQPNWTPLFAIAVLTCALLPLSQRMFKLYSARFVEEL